MKHHKILYIFAFACLGLLTSYVSFGLRKDTLVKVEPSETKLRFIGEFVVPNDKIYGGTLVGGLSGIDYDSQTGNYYLICDDRSEQQPARFYSAKLFFNQSTFDSIVFNGVNFIKQPNGENFPSKEQDKYKVPDPESIRYVKHTKSLLWSSEGERKINSRDTILIDPFLREMDLKGSFVKEYKLPTIFKMSSKETGPRVNGTFEGIALSSDEKFIYLSLEEPLYQDGPRADTQITKWYIRIIKINRSKNRIAAQYAYQLDQIHSSPFPAIGFKVNGVDEIMSVSNDKLFVIERSFALGAFPPNSVRIYEVELKTGSNVNSLGSLQNAEIKTVKKKLLIEVRITQSATNSPRAPISASA